MPQPNPFFKGGFRIFLQHYSESKKNDFVPQNPTTPPRNITCMCIYKITFSFEPMMHLQNPSGYRIS